MKVIEFEDKYRDDMIFMVLSAKDAMGQIPRLNNDLLDIRANYLDEGDMFWLALDDNERVIGCLGFNRLNSSLVKLHRFFVKPVADSEAIYSALLAKCEDFLSSSCVREITAHLTDMPSFAKELFTNSGYVEYQPYWMKKII